MFNSNFYRKKLGQRYNNKLNDPIYSYKKTSLTPKFSLYKIVNIHFILTVFFLFTEIILQYFILLNNNFITVLTIDFLCINIRFYIYGQK